MMVEIWGKPACPYCVQAKQLCEKLEFNYVYKELGIDFDRDAIMEEFPGARTFPQIKVDDVSIGGYTELAQYVENRDAMSGLTL